MTANVIWIETIDEQKPVLMFAAPDNIVVAKQLWLFLVENLQPSFLVVLSSFNGAAELTRPSGQKPPPEFMTRLFNLDLDGDNETPLDEEDTCADCGDVLEPADLLNCSCGDQVCENCYFEHDHADHDTNPLNLVLKEL